MAMMVTTPLWCLRPPPDPPPLLFLGLMQHCSSSLKIMVTALPPPSQPRSPLDPPPIKHFPAETLSPVKPAEPRDPPDASVSLVPLRIFVTSSRSSPQATQILDLMFNLSSKLSDGDAALVVTGDTILVYWRSFSVLYRLSLCQCSFPVVYRSYLCQLGNGSSNSSCSSFLFMHPLIDVQVHFSSLLSGYPYSFEWDAMLDVWVIRALVGIVLIDYVSFGYILMSLGCFYSAIECSLPIASWFQICLTSSRVEYLMLVCRFSARWWFQILIITTLLKPTSTFLLPLVLYCCFSCVVLSASRLEDYSTDDSLSVLFKGSTSWCHISAIPSVVEIRGRLCNVDAAWDAKARNCDIGVIFSGESTITLPNLCESRNHVSSALMAEAIAVRLAVATVVYSNVRSLAVLSDSLSLIKLLKNGGSQPELFGIMFDIYHYLSYFDDISCTFISQNFNGKADPVAKSAFSLVVTIPLVGV
ncbi:unnamed protein product [Brassica napus]|uniref:(rape) hypothetical protein n=1 Tax=Brassica napus TaxID=3708 RepID=A0A816KAJ7_BRANA|nr:unnamed protein product [Brassica napus]